MRKQYDFSKAKQNPHARHLKRQVTIRLDEKVLAYFKALSGDTEIPYQTLINLYLLDCANKERRISLRWARGA
ncbi:MAG: antitoxin [Planctomycetota bacterium]|nr:MAG: antitoxin [Planctomycetota bacterium]